MYTGVHVKCPLFLSGLHKTCNFSIDFRKTLRYKIFRKIRPVGAEMFHADRQADG